MPPGTWLSQYLSTLELRDDFMEGILSHQTDQPKAQKGRGGLHSATRAMLLIKAPAP